MRLIKETGIEYTPFSKRLAVVDKRTGETKPSEAQRLQADLLQLMTAHCNQIERAQDRRELFALLQKATASVLSYKEIMLFRFDETRGFMPEFENADEEVVKNIRDYAKEGVLEGIFETGSPIMLPRLSSYRMTGAAYYYLVYPLTDETKRTGLFALLLSADDKEVPKEIRDYVRIILSITYTRLRAKWQSERVAVLYEELQSYQAKLSNDFRLATVGELTYGITEEILSPLQVILSEVGLLEEDGVDLAEIKRIKLQIKKIHSVITRLVKFATLNKSTVTIEPCDVNIAIDAYYEMVRSSLEALRLECVLDLEKGIPPVLSHPNYMHQLLANVLGVIKSYTAGDGGVILQTRFRKDTVMINFISTAKVKPISEGNPGSLNMRIIETLMQKHEGDMVIASEGDAGSVITLRFPLKRKIRE